VGRVLLVNANTLQPPVSPVGLDYVGSALEAAGIEVGFLDLAFVERDAAESELLAAAARFTPDVIGVSVRNTDDCSMASRDFLLPPIARWIAALKRQTDAPVVVGGIGFSVLPRESFEFLGADYGIAGDGEVAFPRLVESLCDRKPVEDIPGLLWRTPSGEAAFNPPAAADLGRFPLPKRRTADNPGYLREGGMVGIETKRGCESCCIYCADPVAKGRRFRLRPPRLVVAEIRDLLDQGVDVYHTCDSEFNLPGSHAGAVCEAILEAGLGDRIRWYAYCSPVPFDDGAARLYRKAGCRGINFGCDSGSDAVLARLGRAHRRADIARAVAAAKSAGISCMLDFLLGGPGETLDSIRETVEFARSVGADRVGLSIGVRVYPGTALAEMVFGGAGKRTPPEDQRERRPDLLRPYFWIEPAVADSVNGVVRDLVGGDERFFFLDPSQAEANYNYNDNTMLVEAIRRGYRGAFWDILRRVAENSPPD